MASARRATILTAAGLVAGFAGFAVAGRVSTPLAVGAAAAVWCFIVVALGCVLVRRLDRRAIDELARRVEGNHKAVVREVSRLRWIVRDANRERPRWADQDTVELRVSGVLRQLAALRGQIEHIEGYVYAEAYMDGVRTRVGGHAPNLRRVR